MKRLAWAAWALALLALVLAVSAPTMGLEVPPLWPVLLAALALLLTWRAAGGGVTRRLARG